MQNPSPYRILNTFILVLLVCFISIVSAQAAKEDVMIILDASGSMWGRIDERPKIDIAREVMGKVLGDLDGKANIGVLTYGHRKKGDCGDIETIIPVGRVDRQKYMSVINKLSPKGKTPITDAVQKAADELRFTEEKATVVLISDGLETCDADPCALARQLESQGIDFTVHVIGFGLKNEDTTSLQCLAAETGGKYLAADNADELSEAFGTIVAQAPQPEVAPEPEPEPVPEPADELAGLKVEVRLAPDSKPLDRAYVYIIPEAANQDSGKAASYGTINRVHEVKPGNYYVETSISLVHGSTEVEVKSGEENLAVIVLNAGLLSVDAMAEEGGEPMDSAYVYIYEAEAQTNGKRKQVTGAHQRTIFTLPAGKYYVTVTAGEATVGREVEVIAGEKTDTVIVLAAGLLQVSVLEAEGGKPQVQGVHVYIYESEKQTDGKRKRLTGANPRKTFSLPAGKYYVEAVMGKAKVGQEIEVTAAELTEVSIVVGVGAFKAQVVPAEGAKPLDKAYVYIYELEKQTDGSRTKVTGANQRRTLKLPAGKYYAEAVLDKAKAGIEFEVMAGKFTETTINLNAGALKIDAAKKVYIKIYTSEKNLDGTRDHITSMRPGNAVMFPAGKYFVEGKQGDKTAMADIEIKAGKLTEISLKP